MTPSTRICGSGPAPPGGVAELSHGGAMSIPVYMNTAFVNAAARRTSRFAVAEYFSQVLTAYRDELGLQRKTKGITGWRAFCVKARILETCGKGAAPGHG